MSKKKYELEDPKGFTDTEGNYVPTEEELRERFPGKLDKRDLSSDNYRMQVWRHPPTMNLIPFSTPEEARAKQLNSAKSRSNRIQKYKEDKKEQALYLDVLKDELADDALSDLDPFKLLQLRAKMAVLENDWDKVEELAVTMVEFTKPKLSRVDQNTKHVEVGAASMEDMEKFLEGDISYEDFIAKTKED